MDDADSDEERRVEQLDGEEDELNEQLGAAMKAIAAAKRRRDQGPKEIRPERGVRVAWRTTLRVYVTPSSSRDRTNWIVAPDHFS